MARRLRGQKPKRQSDLTEAARKLGKAGGKVGGPARAAALTSRERSAIAKKGGEAAAKKKK